MKILVIGGGGREFAVVKKLLESKNVSEVICAPGNGGISGLPRVQCVSIPAVNISEMVDYAKANGIDFVVVTPDDPLALGMVDAMESAGIPSFGSDKKAARIEAEKDFAKEIMISAGIKTAKYDTFTEASHAEKYVDELGYPVVIKATGLAKGKGVIIAENQSEAYKAIQEMLCGGVFGKAGEKIIIEEFLEGTELSAMYFCDGKNFAPMVSAKDYKRISEGDVGLNTGGMGAFAPCEYYTDDIKKEVDEVIEKTLVEMQKRGCPFKGVLYAGFILTKKGPYVLEYNARFGDPETQVVLPLLKSDLLDIMIACRNGSLKGVPAEFLKASCVSVVMASEGYPISSKSGDEIFGLENVKTEGTWVAHAGTKLENGRFFTAGGRVLNVCAIGENKQQAIDKAYEAVEKISFKGVQYRKDIGTLPK